ncbi:MAG: hypothetical protein ACJAXA_003667 [Candidatus Aldehydirespiratoraceae bacterium]
MLIASRDRRVLLAGGALCGEGDDSTGSGSIDVGRGGIMGEFGLLEGRSHNATVTADGSTKTIDRNVTSIVETLEAWGPTAHLNPASRTPSAAALERSVSPNCCTRLKPITTTS